MKPIEEPAAVNAMRDAQAIAFAKALQTSSAPRPHHVTRAEGELLHIEQPDLDALDAAAIERVESEPVPEALLRDLAEVTDHTSNTYDDGYWSEKVRREAWLTRGLPDVNPDDADLNSIEDERGPVVSKRDVDNATIVLLSILLAVVIVGAFLIFG